MSVCVHEDLQKPLTDLFSIDGWPLEQPPLRGVAWPQLRALADTNNVAQLVHLNKLEQGKKGGNNLLMSNDAMVSVRFKIEFFASLGKL